MTPTKVTFITTFLTSTLKKTLSFGLTQVVCFLPRDILLLYLLSSFHEFFYYYYYHHHHDHHHHHYLECSFMNWCISKIDSDINKSKKTLLINLVLLGYSLSVCWPAGVNCAVDMCLNWTNCRYAELLHSLTTI